MVFRSGIRDQSPISMFYNSFRVLNYAHIHEVLFKERAKTSKIKKKEESR